jgi:membrane protein
MRFASEFRLPLPVRELVTRTIAEVQDDNCVGLAAQLAFYFFLALFPALLFLVALLGYVPIDDTLGAVLDGLAPVAPQQLVVLLRQQIDELSRGDNAALLTFGILGAIWSSSAAMVAIIDALNEAYDVVERRPWWKRRIVAIALTIALATFIVAALVFVLTGPDVVAWAVSTLGLRPELGWLWRLARWPMMILLAMLAIDFVYHFAPNLKREWAWLTPGAVLATALWMASSFGFKLYVSRFADFNATHGAIGGVIVVLLWFYVSSFSILIGAEINGIIAQTSRRE